MVLPHKYWMDELKWVWGSLYQMSQQKTKLNLNQQLLVRKFAQKILSCTPVTLNQGHSDLYHKNTECNSIYHHNKFESNTMSKCMLMLKFHDVVTAVSETAAISFVSINLTQNSLRIFTLNCFITNFILTRWKCGRKWSQVCFTLTFWPPVKVKVWTNLNMLYEVFKNKSYDTNIRGSTHFWETAYSKRTTWKKLRKQPSC